jgi:hypothetical protein
MLIRQSTEQVFFFAPAADHSISPPAPTPATPATTTSTATPPSNVPRPAQGVPIDGGELTIHLYDKHIY